MKRIVVGFIRREVSGDREFDDYVRIAAVAADLGGIVTLLKYSEPDLDREVLLVRLMNLVYNERADALVVPSREHLTAAEVRELAKWAEVIDADTGEPVVAPSTGGRDRPRLHVIGEEKTGGLPLI